jgi:hypothetical protein
MRDRSGFRIAVGVTVAIAIVASQAATAGAQRTLPPGNSAVNQYTEPLPTPQGAEVGDLPKRSPTTALGKSNAERLEAMGPDGRRAAALAAASSSGRQANRAENDSQTVAADSIENSEPDSAGVGDLVRRITGTSSTSQTGLFAPLGILAAALASLIYFWRRQRPAP